MILRRAIKDDAAGFTAALDAAYACYQHLGLPPVTEGIADDIRDHSVWVAELDGNIRGGIVLVLGTQAHIANLAVHPEAGGHGIGKALIAQALAAAAAAGHSEVQLATHVDMTGTQAFYRKAGWKETGRAGKKVYFSKQLH
ncbi:GNAT family N-acetyltransferase [Loktanella sp. Alg231-35]|uniref:GNAT family N-acetyltransferase n=1 Tax=Loktanella sp. Alg231-35 TaxID=1922220 RepID=UPI000D55EC98|nr:GNAT family N-acetyltransferase [Loktanella sp. Alg231-35]